MENKEKQIKEIIDKLNPYLMYDGGSIEFIKYEDNIVYVKMGGSCAGCQMIDLTLKDIVETSLMNEIPEIKEVKNII